MFTCLLRGRSTPEIRAIVSPYCCFDRFTVWLWPSSRSDFQNLQLVICDSSNQKSQITLVFVCVSRSRRSHAPRPCGARSCICRKSSLLMPEPSCLPLSFARRTWPLSLSGEVHCFILVIG